MRRAPPISRLLAPSSLRRLICGKGFCGLAPEAAGAAAAKLPVVTAATPRSSKYFFIITSLTYIELAFLSDTSPAPETGTEIHSFFILALTSPAPYLHDPAFNTMYLRTLTATGTPLPVSTARSPACAFATHILFYIRYSVSSMDRAIHHKNRT
ncbi:hypothetical protein D3C84_783530 [compost metagenome]